MEQFNLTPGEFDDSKAISYNGNLYDIGVTTIRWDNPIGLNAYDTSKFVHWEEDRKTGKKVKKVVKGKRYGKRWGGISAIKVFALHHTGGYTPEATFRTLHEIRKLSVPHILGDNGINYQTLDPIVKAWHIGKMNPISDGVEVCSFADAESNPGAYSKKKRDKLGVSTHKIVGQFIQGADREVFELPKSQVDALVKLVAGSWVARANERGPIYLNNNPAAPLFMVNDEGKVLMNFSKNVKNHEGIILHANSSEFKWDMAGIVNMEAFEERVSDTFYKFLNKMI